MHLLFEILITPISINVLLYT